MWEERSILKVTSNQERGADFQNQQRSQQMSSCKHSCHRELWETTFASRAQNHAHLKYIYLVCWIWTLLKALELT